MTVTWAEPPPSRGTGVPRRDWQAIGAELKRRPMRWAIVAVFDQAAVAASTASNIRSGKLASLQRLGRFEAQARKASGEYRVYARYLGP